MTVTIDIYFGPPPKRGDLLQTNVGNRRERTCFILKTRELKSQRGVPRFRLEAVRWWQIEAKFRMLLFRYAERHGGQRVVHFRRYPPKRKPDFEEYMRSGISRVSHA